MKIGDRTLILGAQLFMRPKYFGAQKFVCIRFVHVWLGVHGDKVLWAGVSQIRGNQCQRNCSCDAMMALN